MSQQNDVLKRTYIKKTDKEHILDNPDTYTGSMHKVDINTFIYDDISKKIKSKDLSEIILGLYKLFDEGIVNCRDHYVRSQKNIKSNIPNTHPVTYIDVSVSSDGTITFMNDGNGIDIIKHPTYNTWIPELIFFHLRTGTNYNKTDTNIIGGKNGFGAKLIYIWSKLGHIETVDHIRQLKYSQRCSNNLEFISEPTVITCKGKPYTKISFKPDYERLGIPNGLSSDMMKLLKRRTYDIAAVTDCKVVVKWNSKSIQVKGFQNYVNMYIGTKKEKQRVYEIYNERWEYIVCLSNTGEFQQVSFVNGIHTGKGGRHVDYIINQIVKNIQNIIFKRKKVMVKPNTIKEQLMLFLRCDIENPSFDSQTKDFLNTNVKTFGSNCEPSLKFCEKVSKMGVADIAYNLNEIKVKKIASKSDGKRKLNVNGVVKLIDAHYAGGCRSHECTIIFCEGDSAKAGIVSGLSRNDREFIGIYPLKGKLLNVRGETMKKISTNNEIVDIKKILGLKTDKEYSTLNDIQKTLRYGKILFMTDQDLDGSHIKGLCLNLFHYMWKSILKLNIIGFMNTPIIKITKNDNIIYFYSDQEYRKWKEVTNVKFGWKIKYYKGLGTSTGKEFKEYYKNKKIIYFQYTDKTDDIVDMVFNKKRSKDRKKWLMNYNQTSCINNSSNHITFTDFINHELIHFSTYDCNRSIPNIMDGLKTSQRKILFAAFKKNITSEIKVAQFSGYVSEHTMYHHGENSLNGTIINMAQEYMGSNNINLLLPNGQFGTRLIGGRDSASERYIYTQLNPITRYIFPESDDKILNTVVEDNIRVEPEYYAPIIPMLLVNGARGIGTGFSTNIQCYNTNTIIDYLVNRLLGNDVSKTVLDPYYEGFKGIIKNISTTRITKYLLKGLYRVLDEKRINVYELPVGTWTTNYKAYLETLISNISGKPESQIVKYVDRSTDQHIDITIAFNPGVIDRLENEQTEHGINGIEMLLKLYTTVTSNNMHMFNTNGKLILLNTVHDILNTFFETRYKLYYERKKHMIAEYAKHLVLLQSKSNYIQEILNGTIDLRNVPKTDILKTLNNKGYKTFDNDLEYSYLLNMHMQSLSKEAVCKLKRDELNTEAELDNIKHKTIEQIWINDLKILKSKYGLYKLKRLHSQTEIQSKKRITKHVKTKKTKKLKIM